MKFLIFFIVTTLFTVSGNLLTKAKAQSNNLQDAIQFVCNQHFDPIAEEYLFATLAWRNHNHKKVVIFWKKEDSEVIGFDPQKRCELVSPRFQKAYENNSLEYITTGIMKGQPVICTASLIGEDCVTLLLTLRHQDNPLEELEKLTDILLGYSSKPLDQSSAKKTHELIHKVKDRFYIEVDIDDFLKQEE